MLDKIEGHSFLTAPLRSNPTVLDLGANQGAFSRRIAERYAVRIVGVEPVPELFAALPNVPGATFEQLAVTAVAGPVTLYVNPGTDSTILDGMREGEARAIEVQALTLGDLMDRHGIDRAGLVKMDIEGAELAILSETDVRALQQADQLAVEFHDFADPDQAPRVTACKQRLVDFGFACLPFSRDNSNVLFVNQRYPITPATRTWLYARYKYPQGIARIIGRQAKP